MSLTLKTARTICEISDWTISPLRLQKILYLMYMFYYGQYNCLLIDGNFEATDIGPQHKELYEKVRMYGIKSVQYICGDSFNINDREYPIIKKYYEQLNPFTDAQLISIIHSESGAWAKNYMEPYSLAISHEDVLDQYLRLFNKIMKLISNNKVLVPSDIYYFGDPCYAFSHEEWNNIILTCKNTPIATYNNKNILIFSTSYGDGIYNSDKIKNISVDSGSIGLVPVDIATQDVSKLMFKIEFNNETLCENKNGILSFGKYFINTV